MKWLKTLKIERPISCSRQSLLTLSLSLYLSSCATTASYKTVKLPAYAGAYFSECTNKDGSISIEVYESSKVQQIFDADFSADGSGDFSLASYSPLGQTLFQIDYSAKAKAFKQTGKPFEAFQNLAVDKENVLTLDGHDLGLRADEVACLLNQKLPQRWLKKIVGEESDAHKTHYIIHDADRVITVNLPKTGSKGDESWSAKIDWSLYWGFKKLSLDVKLLRNEQALVLHANQFDAVDVRIIAQEE